MRTGVSYMLLVYAVYVPSSARRTLVVASLMTVPLLGRPITVPNLQSPASPADGAAPAIN